MMASSMSEIRRYVTHSVTIVNGPVTAPAFINTALLMLMLWTSYIWLWVFGADLTHLRQIRPPSPLYG
jgi:hypothetical protein